jgi:hypothetical protein
VKSPKIISALLVLFFSLQICFAQAKPESVLMEEFSELSCDDLRSRLDNFFIAILNDPTATGYVIIQGSNKNFRQSYGYRSMIHGHIKYRRFDPLKLKIVRVQESEKLRVQFWLTPAGADAPYDSESSRGNPLLLSKSIMIYSEYNDSDGCLTDNLSTFFEILTQQPNLRAHFVINAKSVKEFNEKKKELMTEFKEIPSNRLRFFYVRNRTNSYVEYWLVPPKKK